MAPRPLRAFLLTALLLPVPATVRAQAMPREPHPAGTPELREALFDTILARTARREAFSAPKERTLGYDPLREMESLREAFIAADTQEDLFYALVRVSAARRDRHLSVALVPGGVRPERTNGLEGWGGGVPPPAPHAPVRILPDFGPDGGYFVADVAVGVDDVPEPGEKVVAVNGRTPEAWETEAAGYLRHSTVDGLRWKVAEGMPARSADLPPRFHRDRLELETVTPDGNTRGYALPYVPPASLTWRGVPEPSYPGFATVLQTPTFDLLLPEDDRPVVLLRWHRFQPTLIDDVDRLMALAEARNLLDHAVIVDATRSAGGSLGAYALQRIQPRRFRTTFGTLRVSDVIPAFIEGKRQEIATSGAMDGDGREGVDDGSWLLDWLEEDLTAAYARGDSVTEPVPFKLAHAPKDSDGVLEPAPVHFQGPLVVFLGPHGGSHLDQFASIVVDNDLGRVVGQTAGGYSNTWEWEEVLTLPGTDRPVAGFMYSIGHTIRPNGEVLEGNPALPHDPLPLTRENFDRYYALLMERAEAYFREVGHPAGRPVP